MKVVGLTGGIGSGKTTVANIFKALGVPTYIADYEAKLILDNDLEVRKAVKALLGTDSYHLLEGEEKANRAYIAKEVFDSPDHLAGLNSIIHPRVRLHFQNWKDQQAHVYCVYEAAILIESGGHTSCDSVVLVTTDEAIRVKRVMERDQASMLEVRKRLQNQMPDREKLSFVNYVIYNDDLEKLAKFIHHINDNLLKEYG